MRCTVRKTVLASFLEALAPIAQDCRVIISSRGVEVKVVCTANVSLVIATLPRDAFVEFDEGGAEEMVGLEIAKILTAVNMADGADDEICIEKGVDDPQIRITAPGVKYVWRSIDPYVLKKDPNPPAIELPTTVTMGGGDFKKAVDKIARISDKIRFTVDDDGKFSLQGEGDDNQVNLDLEATVIGPRASSLFSLDYISSMAKPIGKAETVSIRLSIAHPVILEFCREGGEYQYMLAPRIEAD